MRCENGVTSKHEPPSDVIYLRLRFMSRCHPTPDPAEAGVPTSAMAAASRLAVLICLVNPAEGGACCGSESEGVEVEESKG